MRTGAPARYTGVAAVVILWATVLTGMHRTGLGLLDDRPISFLGTDPRSTAVFRGGLIAAAVSMAVFARFVRARFSASKTFLAVVLVGLVGQVVAALVPISGPGSSRGLHTAGGLVLGGSLPLLMWCFAAARPPGRLRGEAFALFGMEVAATAVGVGLSMGGRAAMAEIVPALGFHVWVGVVTARSRADPTWIA